MDEQTEKKTILKLFGERIRKIRKEQKLSQEQLSDEARIERSYMGTIERGERNPTLHKVYKIAKALKTHSSKLLPF